MSNLLWKNPLHLERLKNWLEGAASIDVRWCYKEVSAKQMEEKISVITRYSKTKDNNNNNNKYPLSDMEAIKQVFRWRNQGRLISGLFLASAPFLYIMLSGFWAVVIAILPWLVGLFYCDFLANKINR
jgi:hypothetical protein